MSVHVLYVHHVTKIGTAVCGQASADPSVIPSFLPLCIWSAVQTTRAYYPSSFLSSYCALSITRNKTCSYMQRCRRIQSSLLSLSGTNPRWSVHLHHRFVQRGPVELPLDARRSYLSPLISTSLATPGRGHVDRFDLNQKSRGSRTIALPNMADKSNARSEEQHATADALKLVNRLHESRSPYVGPSSTALCSVF
jgi:hypothetical protein